jgi:hypothetical protein
MHVTIKPADDVLIRYGNQLGALGAGDAHKALARSVNRVTKTVEGRVISAVAKQSSIPRAIVARGIKTRLASPKLSHGTALEGEVWSTGKPLSLKVFGAKQFQFGVRAKIWGRVERFPGAFIYAGTYKSGKPVGGGHVFQRLTRHSNPIEMKTGPSIPEEMVKDESERIFRETVETMLPQRIAHEIGRLLPGLK